LKWRSTVVEQASSKFSALAREQGLDPTSEWVGGYVEHVWKRRKSLTAYLPPLDGLPILEFGCNVGATAIVLARLGAEVTAIDVDMKNVALAAANAAEHGQRITFLHVDDTRTLPFRSGTFKIITCASVLEYVKREHLPGVMREIDRVLAPGGILLIDGTSSRISPREVHSRRWFANWLPYWLMPDWQRGVWPWQIRPAGYIDLAYADRDRSYLKGKRAGFVLRALAIVAHLVGRPLGYFMPSTYLALQKPFPIESQGRG
jgi:2-polyprenyl-3-methyl-5-hydroxy-6-metoxy-1,4-benzoquinol methylase